MERDHYEARLRGFENLVSTALLQSAILESMIRTDEDTLAVLDKHGAFFSVVHRTLNNSMMLEAAKALDRDKRAASLQNLANAAQDCPELAPDVDVSDIQDWIQENKAVIDDLRKIRNTRLAHFDALVEPPGGLIYGEFVDLLTELREHWLTLYLAFHGIAAVMDSREDEARTNTGELMQELIEQRRSRLDEGRHATLGGDEGAS